jgi:S1-C subfamily serine protease
MVLNKEIQIDRTMSATNRKLRPGQEKPEEYDSHEFLAVLSFITVAIVGPLLLLGIYMIVYAQLGLTLNSDTTPAQGVQVALWFTVWGAICLALILKFLRDKKGHFLRYCRNLFLYIGPVILIASSVGFVWQYTEYNHTAGASPVCDLNASLQKALAATVPIATNLGTGTGFAIDAHGSILTAYHVIDGAKTIYENNENGEKPAYTILKTSPDHDLALLHLDKETPSFLSLDTNYQTSDPVYAVGYPGNTFTAGQASVSTGIVSRVVETADIRLSSADVPADLSFVQTDAAVNPGNSGGALIDKCGVAGVVDAISDSGDLHQYNLPVSEQNISYAISSKTVKTVLGL